MTTIRQNFLPVLAAVLLNLSAGTHDVSAHCQVPCGIYDDPARFVALLEHVTTIEKAMTQISELSSAADSATHSNQIVRWTLSKEQHADELAKIVSHYFMAQRIKPAPEGDEVAAKKYATHLELLHHMIVRAMKCKQTTDLEHCSALEELITDFKASYLGE